VKRCSSKPEEQEHQGRKRVLGLASAIESASSSRVDNGVLKMLSRMHDDDIASVIRNDFCLLRYADTLFRNMDMTLQNMTISAKESVSWEDSCKPSAKGLQS
jgi:hypothetical protein